MSDQDIINNNPDQENEAAAENKASGMADDLTSLQEQVSRLKEEAAHHYDQYLRSVADIDNLRKRTAREKEEYLRFASLPVLKKILPVVDDLERALQMSEGNNDYDTLYKGLEMITRRMHEIVAEEGVQTIEAVGQPFDPQYHQPLAVEASSEHPENTVIEELQKGYVLHGRVIRPSLVKVSS